MEHGVLGSRWAYDGCHDPVLITQLLALFEGHAEPQAQSLTDTPDHEITWSYTGDTPLSLETLTPADDHESTRLPVLPATTLQINRILRPAPDSPVDLAEGATGHLVGHWDLPDGSRAHALFAVVCRNPQA
jgi:hypothetical protein